MNKTKTTGNKHRIGYLYDVVIQQSNWLSLGIIGNQQQRLECMLQLLAGSHTTRRCYVRRQVTTAIFDCTICEIEHFLIWGSLSQQISIAQLHSETSYI